jgi:drug/metabolite transporter (DMT)-like permease
MVRRRLWVEPPRSRAKAGRSGIGAFLPLIRRRRAAQFWWTRSLSLAPPSAVVPFNYLSLVWATILGFAVWGDVPTPGLLVGSAIVVASGLYILWRERPYAADARLSQRRSGRSPA